MNRLRHEEAGFGVAEAIVAVMIIAIGLVAVLAAFAATEKQTSVAQRQSQAVGIAQRDIESIRNRSYANVATTTVPSPGTDGLDPGDRDPQNPRDPNFYVSAGPPLRFKVKQNFRDKNSAPLPGTPTAGELFVPASASGIAQTSTFNVNGTSGTIHRYLTWRDEFCGVNLPGPAGHLAQRVSDDLLRLSSPLAKAVTSTVLGTQLNAFCADTQDAKRVTVAVVLDRRGNGAGPDRPIWLSTIVYDPARGLITF